MRQFVAAFALILACACLGGARSASAAEPLEASMQVSGTIEVDAEGKVTHYALEHEDSYPAGIVDLLRTMVPGWRFEPVLVDGMAQPARANMYLLFVARKAGEDNYAIALRSARFGTSSSEVRALDRKPPLYPDVAMHERASGTVYLALRIDARGRVAEVFAEQTNLYRDATPREQSRWRRDFERAAKVALRDWTFELSPATAAKGGTTVRVPVAFLFPSQIAAQSLAGHWQAYLPGPLEAAPWIRRDLATNGVDALPDGMIQEVGSGLKLLTPLNAG
jgi:hypothetical protein